MPANLPPQYLEAEKRYRLAKEVEEKLEALREMLAIIPKHKGTDKIRADLKRKISKFRAKDSEDRRRSRKGYSVKVEREGAGQVVVVGSPNVGKSQLLASLTNATPQVAEYPFTTRRPLPGMMKYKDIQIQLVDSPPITPDFIDPWLTPIIRNADAVLVLVELNDDSSLEEVKIILGQLERGKIKLVRETVKEDKSQSILQKKAIIVGNKNDLDGAKENYKVLREPYDQNFPTISISAKTGSGLEELREKIFQILDIVRVYTKAPGKKPDLNQPFVLKKGSTVLDLARAIHKEFTDKLKFARIWGRDKYAGQTVDRRYILRDEDIIELHHL